MGNVLATLRRLEKRERRFSPGGRALGSRGLAFSLPGAPGEAALTREDFFESLEAAQARVGRVYVAGLLERLTDEEQRPMLDAEERIDAAARAGDFVAASEAVREWEGAYFDVMSGGRRKRE